jgi:A/G-specific adenine glycosylase
MAKRKKGANHSTDEDSASDFDPASIKRPALSRRKRRSTAAARKNFTAAEECAEASASTSETYATPHSTSRHLIYSPESMRTSLLEWYSGVHEVRGMPWRMPFDSSLDADARAQRAYEVRSQTSLPPSSCWLLNSFVLYRRSGSRRSCFSRHKSLR